jgi:hypothetical protein
MAATAVAAAARKVEITLPLFEESDDAASVDVNVSVASLFLLDFVVGALVLLAVGALVALVGLFELLLLLRLRLRFSFLTFSNLTSCRRVGCLITVRDA